MPNRYEEVLKDIRAKKNPAASMAELIRWISELAKSTRAESRADFETLNNELIAHPDEVIKALQEKPEPVKEKADPKKAVPKAGSSVTFSVAGDGTIMITNADQIHWKATAKDRTDYAKDWEDFMSVPRNAAAVAKADKQFANKEPFFQKSPFTPNPNLKEK